MAITVSGTTITFNDATTQTTAGLVSGGALGTPSSGTLTNCTSIPVSQATGTLAVANGGTGGTTQSAARAGIGAGTGNGNGNGNGNGTVTSVATGNGLTGGTITGSGTLSITAPSYQSVGSYMILYNNTGTTMTANNNFSGDPCKIFTGDGCGGGVSGNQAGTWRALGQPANVGGWLALRVS
jgi:hypothetical protein